MEKLRQEIRRIKRHRLEYYQSHLALVEDYIDEKPDISIETCKALIEGISKLSLHLLIGDPIAGKKVPVREGSTKKRDEEFQKLVKRALMELQKGRGYSDADMCNRLGSVVHYIGEIRNEHGDICHGRASLKEQVNDVNFAELVIAITDSICTYMLRRLDLLVEKPLEYEDNPDFNQFLDDQKPLPGKIRYSRALFDQELETYALELGDYEIEFNLEDE